MHVVFIAETSAMKSLLLLVKNVFFGPLSFRRFFIFLGIKVFLLSCSNNLDGCMKVFW